MKAQTVQRFFTMKDHPRAEAALVGYAFSYPGAVEENPWGHRAFKVRGKTFLFLSVDATGFGLSTKLPHSGESALQLPFSEPTHYGLGKSGWVTAHFEPKAAIPVGTLRAWIDESYRAIAPRKLVASLPASGPPGLESFDGPTADDPPASEPTPPLPKAKAKAKANTSRRAPTKSGAKSHRTKPRTKSARAVATKAKHAPGKTKPPRRAKTNRQASKASATRPASTRQTSAPTPRQKRGAHTATRSR